MQQHPLFLHRVAALDPWVAAEREVPHVMVASITGSASASVTKASHQLRAIDRPAGRA